MIDPNSVGGDTPPLKFTKYLQMVYDTPEVQGILYALVRRFTHYWITRGAARLRGPLWNLQTMDLSTLDKVVNRIVQEDIHMQGLTVDLGA